MKTEIETNKGGRPTRRESQIRYANAVDMYFKGNTHPSYIASKLGISKTAAIALRNKVERDIKNSATNKDDFELNRNLAIKRAEVIMAKAWDNYHETATFPIYDNLHRQINYHKEKNQVIHTLIAATKFWASLAGASSRINVIQNNNVTNLTVEQKILMNVFNLKEDDLKPKNYQKTLSKIMKQCDS